MKKTIEGLMARLETTENGKPYAGFLSIKGGLSLMVTENKGTCDNKGTCNSTNDDICTNNTCGGSTNVSPGGCTNSGTCLI